MRSNPLPYAVAILLTTCWAASGQPSKTPCADPKSFTNLPLAEVTGERSINAFYFCGLNTNCPMTLERGNPIVVNRVEGDWTCGYFTNWIGAHAGFLEGYIHPDVGWVRSRDIRRVNVIKNPPLSAWVGTWVEGWDQIKIETSKSPGKLSLVGRAQGLSPTDKPIMRQFSGEASPMGNHLHLTEGANGSNSCSVKLTLAGKYILANDNEKCGAPYVHFWGIWKRTRVETK